MLYDKDLMDKLVNTARLWHASDGLRQRLHDVLDEFIPHLDAGCKERGCACYEAEKS